jgi:hypothetical protein
MMKRMRVLRHWRQTDLFREPEPELILPEEALCEASGGIAELLLGMVLPQRGPEECGGGNEPQG